MIYNAIVAKNKKAAMVAAARGLSQLGSSGKGKRKMSTQQTQNAKYGFSKTLDVPYADAVEKVRAALKDEGFGVLSEIDIKDKLKEQLGVDFRNYVILGACNPALAHKTLQQECEFQKSMRMKGVRPGFFHRSGCECI